MGLLVEGVPLRWDDAARHVAYVKEHGLIQFLNVWNGNKDVMRDHFLFGDEIECLLYDVDADRREARLLLRGDEIIADLKTAGETLRRRVVDAKASADANVADSDAAAAASPTSAAAGASKPRQTGTGWNAAFLPEYGRFMIEGTPAKPYGGYTGDLRLVEANMRLRRELVQLMLSPSERMTTMTVFPLLGCAERVGPVTVPPLAVTPLRHNADWAAERDVVGDDAAVAAARMAEPASGSMYVPDKLISPHPRFATLTRNIRYRRQRRVNMNVPLFQDKHTQARKQREADARAAAGTELVDGDLYDPTRQIHMDAMVFGMGSCCLQVTFQARTIDEGRYLYDQLAVLAPLMMALSAASPFFRGEMADIDCRWTVISQSVDCRTRAEMPSSQQQQKTNGDLDATKASADAALAAVDAAAAATASSSSSVSTTPAPAAADAVKPGSASQTIHKSRYDSISRYIGPCLVKNRPEYNDVPAAINTAAYDVLRAGGVDDGLARHVAHLYVRDPLVIYDGATTEVDDSTSTDHFENIQSTNWQSVRFKPPPAVVSKMGWRVEFRTMEVQLSDFENAAYTVFIALLSRAILFFRLNFYVPLSTVDVNMKRAHERDAVTTQKFFFRKRVITTPKTMAKNTSAVDLSSMASASAIPRARGPPAYSGGCGSGVGAAADGDDQDDDGRSGRGNVADEYDEFTLKDIFLGVRRSATTVPPRESRVGLIDLVNSYLDLIKCDAETRAVVDRYTALISARASGKAVTTARYWRNYVDAHPDYKHDSELSQSVVYDMVQHAHEIASGALRPASLFGASLNSEHESRPLARSPYIVAQPTSVELRSEMDFSFNLADAMATECSGSVDAKVCGTSDSRSACAAKLQEQKVAQMLTKSMEVVSSYRDRAGSNEP